MNPTEKTCSKCQAVKPIGDFYSHPKMADGRLNKCKCCTRKDVTDWRHGDGREKVLAYDVARAKSEKRRQHTRRVSQKWVLDNPAERCAQNALNNALRDGRLLRWPNCAVPECDSKKLHGHHPDYSQPLEVVWLCAAHHKQAHALVKKGG